MCTDGPYKCTINLQLTDSMEYMIPTMSRILVLLLVRIQWVKLPVPCKIFLENYGYVCQSAVENSLYQHAR